MSRVTGLLLLVVALAVTACGGSGRTTSAASTTPASLATLDVVRTGGIGADRIELHLRPGDPRLALAQAALGIPLPASSATSSATSSSAPDAAVYVIDAVASDGTTATYTYDEGDVPDDLQKLDAWLAATL